MSNAWRKEERRYRLLDVGIFVIKEEHLCVRDSGLSLDVWKMSCVFLGTVMIPTGRRRDELNAVKLFPQI